PHDERRNVLSFRGKQQLSRRLTDLTDAARGRLELEREDRLHGIDNDKGRLDACDLLEDPLETGLGQQIQRRAADGQPFTARFEPPNTAVPLRWRRQGHSDAGPLRPPVPPRAPRRTSSMPRSRRNAQAISATARRISDRRTQSKDAGAWRHYGIGLMVIVEPET